MAMPQTWSHIRCRCPLSLFREPMRDLERGVSSCGVTHAQGKAYCMLLYWSSSLRRAADSLAILSRIILASTCMAKKDDMTDLCPVLSQRAQQLP